MADLKRVNVYFWVLENAPENPLFPDGNPLTLFPVSRQVNPAAPARPSLQALLDGPTPGEQGFGLNDLSVGGLSIGTLDIVSGTATVDFVGSVSWPGTLSPGRFRMAVEGTLLQFASVQQVQVSVNGDEDFDSNA